MSRPFKLNWPARLALIALTFLITACQDNLARRDTIVSYAGEASAHNRAIHIIDPWPAASARAEIEHNGRRMANAIERYEAPKPPEGGGGPTMLTLPLAVPPAAPTP
jgi:hypothetical protein